MNLGKRLDESGWRQGSLIKITDNSAIPTNLSQELNDSQRLIVISQSCDIIKQPDQAEPYVELIIAHQIEALDGNKTYNKNPRELHCSVLTVAGEQYISLSQRKKFSIDRKLLLSIEPDKDYYLDNATVSVIARWLAARYQRPAFPNEFNERIEAAKRKDRKLGKKERKAARKLSPDISGIFLKVYPFRELDEGENYSVNLMALVPAGRDDIDLDSDEIKAPIEAIAGVMKAAAMDVEFRIAREDKVPYSMFRDEFKLWSYDDISLREDPPHEVPL